jgi:hypothetical protein
LPVRIGLRLRRNRWLRLGGAGVSKEFFLAGFAYAMMNVDSILGFALFHGNRGRASYPLFLLFYLVSPLIRASYEWARLFYFDLKRLELGAFAQLRQRFERRVGKLAWVLGCASWLLASIGGLLLGAQEQWFVYLLLAGFFLFRSRLAFCQICAFVEGRYTDLLVSGVMVFAGAVVLPFLTLDTTARMAGLLVFILGTLLALAYKGLVSGGRGSRPAIVPPPDWLALLRSVAQPVRVRTVCLSLDAPEACVETLARKFSQQVATPLTLMGNRLITWFECGGSRPDADDAWIIHCGGGWVEHLHSTPYQPNGREALQLVQALPLGTEIFGGNSQAKSASASVEAIKERFAETFPQGIVFDPAADSPSELIGLTSAQRREIMVAAAQYAKNLFKPFRRSKFDVTALCPQGKIQLIFIVDKSEDREFRNRWRSFLKTTNLANAAWFGHAGPAERCNAPLSLSVVNCHE